ncbi:MAG: peptide deformylase [Polyangiaceae bacterium]
MTERSHPVVQAGGPVLRKRAAEVPRDFLATSEFRELVHRMISTMRAAPGVGLAAPQIGVGRRIIVLEDREELMARLTPAERAERERTPFAVRTLVNPVLRTVPVDPTSGPARVTFFEGCLSVEGYAAMVERDREVEVSALDERGEPVVWRARGWPARILQHEVDHLDGTLYVDRMHTRSFMTGAAAKERFAGKPVAEVRRELGL